ncbi:MULTISPECIES: hypothetical protein [Methylobacterium]|uniref:Uncharacterized protein n=1 Tax=Methylobacterium thuringiense TaxID=1003091 RepID=A0ABQ4TQV7_9HYPH|nr:MULTISPECIES: hypothetical protein [Methylobacterium]TXN20366.1 hypothetical protein FV217_18275 [Methylobacterium sp. WL9]GJE56228.1 hypothetical protein EKPJFOCH_2727 [Methylobacterium thuringiense]
MIDPAASFIHSSAPRTGQSFGGIRDHGGLSIARVTKGVAMAIGKSLAVERDAALPESLASLVERLQAGPLGQTQRNPRRVA